jgi:hypothetical protein
VLRDPRLVITPVLLQFGDFVMRVVAPGSRDYLRDMFGIFIEISLLGRLDDLVLELFQESYFYFSDFSRL